MNSPKTALRIIGIIVVSFYNSESFIYIAAFFRLEEVNDFSTTRIDELLSYPFFKIGPVDLKHDVKANNALDDFLMFVLLKRIKNGENREW